MTTLKEHELMLEEAPVEEDYTRVQVYRYDMGAWHKAWVATLPSDELDEINESRYYRAVPLPPDDWYGQQLPDVCRDPDRYMKSMTEDKHR